MAGPFDERNYWENQYNPRWSIPDSQRTFDRWTERAARTREHLAADLDIPYGPDPRERLDLFHAAGARGTLVFLHGGYWRSFGKEAQSWVAEPFVRAGFSVAIPSYPLAPAASLTQIVASARRACSRLRGSLLDAGERRRLVVAGHSAGGHLAACVMARPEAAREAPDAPDAPDGPDAIVCISGIFDLLPLLHTRMLGSMGWEAQELHAVSPLYWAPPAHGAVILAVGGEESREFRGQSRRLARAWGGRVTALLMPAGRHHYSVLEGLEDPQDELHRAVLAQLEA